MVSKEAHEIAASLRAARDRSPTVSVHEARRAWEDAAEVHNRALAATVSAVDLGGIPGEWVHPNERRGDGLVVYYHGGGFTTGSCRTHRPLAVRLADASGVPILLVDYRLAPEHPCPAAVEDAVASYRWLETHGHPGSSIVIGGDSAGGAIALAAAVALREGGDTLPAGVFFLSPWLDLSLTAPTLELYAAIDPLTTREGLSEAARLYLRGRDPADPVASPLRANLRGLPPLFIQVGDREILQHDALVLAERASAAGVAHELEVWEGMWHVWHGWAEQVPEARAAISRIGGFVRECLALSTTPPPGMPIRGRNR